MTALEMQVAFEVEAGVLDNLVKPSTYDIFYWLNRGVEKFVKTRYVGDNVDTKGKGFEQTQKRIDDLRELVTEVTLNTVVSTVKPNSYIATIPTNYLFTISEEVGIIQNGTASRQGVTETTADRYRDEIDNPFSEHVYHNNWSRPLRLFYGNTVELISDGTYTVPYLYLRYLRLPVTVSLTINCDLAAHTHSEIVKLAVQMYVESMDPNRYKTIINEVNTME